MVSISCNVSYGVPGLPGGREREEGEGGRGREREREGGRERERERERGPQTCR